MKKILRFLIQLIAGNRKYTFFELARGTGRNIRLDEFPNSQGEFGLELTNPVPVDGISLIQYYIRFLLTDDGQRVQFERAGSRETPQFAGPTDAYDLFTQNKTFLVRLYVNAYAGGTSEKAPKGFRYFRPFKNEPWIKDVAFAMQHANAAEETNKASISKTSVAQATKNPDNKEEAFTRPVKSDEICNLTAFGYFDGKRFNFTTQQAFGSMLLRQKELDAAIHAGKLLSVEEQKERTMLCFLLGSPNDGPDDEPLIKCHALNLEDVKDILAIGEFNFGDIQKYGASIQGINQFFEGIRSGILTIEEAIQVLAESKKWDEVKDGTSFSKEEFLAKKLSALTETNKNRPSNN